MSEITKKLTRKMLLSLSLIYTSVPFGSLLTIAYLESYASFGRSFNASSPFLTYLQRRLRHSGKGHIVPTTMIR